MTDLVKLPALLLCAALAGGCSSVVKLNVRHAPQIDLGAAQTVTVQDFSVAGQVELNVGGERDVLRNLLTRSIAGSLAAPSDVNVQKQHHTALLEALLRNGHFKVSEGAGDVRLSGHVAYKVQDGLSEKEWKDTQSGEKKERYTLTRTTTAEVSFQVADAQGVVLGAARVSESLQRKWEGKDAQEVRKSAEHQSVEDDVLKVVTATAAPLVNRIAPYFVLESRTLEDGDSKQIAEGNKAAEAGRWDEAARAWRPFLSSHVAEDRNAALYNLSIYDEYTGQLDAALIKLEQLYNATLEARYAEAGDRMRLRIEEVRKLRASEQARAAAAPH